MTIATEEKNLKGKMTPTKTNSDWMKQLFPLRVLAELDKVHGFYVAYCLETGSVTTGDDMETVLDMMKELLEDEVSRVIKSENLSNFFSTPAPFEVWEQWATLAQRNGGVMQQLPLDLKLEGTGKNAGRTTAVAVLKKAA